MDYGTNPAPATTTRGRKQSASFLNITVEIGGVKYQTSLGIDLEVEGTLDIDPSDVQVVACNVNSAKPKPKGLGLAAFATPRA